MSSLGNRIVMLVIMLVLLSCSNDMEERLVYYKKNALPSKQMDESKLVFQLANDTINKWIAMKLKYFFYLDKMRDSWKLDSIVFFNSKFDKCVINMPIQGEPNKQVEVNDAITLLLGEKINGKWWFYDGPQYAVLRNGYTTKLTQPLSLEFLTDRARRNALSWYYIEKPTSTCTNKLFSEGYGSYKKCSSEKYLINNEYFETSFNWEVNRREHPNFLKNKFN